MKKIVFCMLFGYFVGTFNPAYVFGRLKGFDIRQHGSGNAGASNAVLLMGKATGAICAFLDILKAYIAYKLAALMFPKLAVAGILAGASCIIGHMFPIWMRFRGGKGLACLGGVILAYNSRIFGVLLLLEIILVLIVDYVCMVAISASILFPSIYMFREGELLGILALAVVASVMLYKHMENLRRIQQGREARVSYLWNKEQETERLRTNYD